MSKGYRLGKEDAENGFPVNRFMRDSKDYLDGYNSVLETPNTAEEFFKPADHVANLETMLTQANERIEELAVENMAMYSALYEASKLGPNAAGRCKLELQRIARNDADLIL